MTPEEFENKILLYWSGELDEVEAQEVETHLRTHPDSASMLQDLNSVREELRAMETAPLSRSRVQIAVDRHAGGHDSRFRRTKWSLRGLAAMLLLGLAVFAYLQTGTPAEKIEVKQISKEPGNVSAKQLKRIKRRAKVFLKKRKALRARKRIVCLKERIHALRTKITR